MAKDFENFGAIGALLHPQNCDWKLESWKLEIKYSRTPVNPCSKAHFYKNQCCKAYEWYIVGKLTSYAFCPCIICYYRSSGCGDIEFSIFSPILLTLTNYLTRNALHRFPGNQYKAHWKSKNTPSSDSTRRSRRREPRKDPIRYDRDTPGRTRYAICTFKWYIVGKLG